jgi:hypothetical protein
VHADGVVAMNAIVYDVRAMDNGISKFDRAGIVAKERGPLTGSVAEVWLSHE